MNPEMAGCALQERQMTEGVSMGGVKR